MRSSTLGLVLLVPSVGLADGSAALRVTDEGLAWLGEQAISQIPREMEMEDMEYDLMDCWPVDSTFELWQGHLAIDDAELGFPLGRDAVAVELSAGIRADGTAILDAIGCMPLSVSCDVAIQAQDARISAPLELGSAVAMGEVELTLDPADVELELTNCTGEVDQFLEALYEQLEPAILDLLRSRLDAWIEEEVRPRIDQVLASTFTVPIDMADVDATVRMGGATAGNDAVELVASIGLEPREVSACVPAEAPELDPDGGVAFAQWDPSPFALSVSERLLDEGLLATWRSGKMCFPPKDLSMIDGLVEGLPEGVDLSVTFVLGTPPDVDLGPEGAEVILDDVSALVHYSTPAGEGDAVIEGSASARAMVEIDPGTNGVRLQVTEPAIGEMVMASGELPEGTDLRPVVEGLVFPMLLDFVGDVRLLDAVIPVSDWWVIGNAIDYRDGSASLAFELFAAPEADGIGPDTFVLEAPPAFVATGTELRIVMGGSDDLVPERLLRYQIREEDGGDYSEPTFSPTFAIRRYEPGTFAFEIRAIDLAGNVDPDPAKVVIEIDAAATGDHPPTLPPPEDDSDSVTPPPGPQPVDGGCSCRTSGPGRGLGPWLLAFLVALLRVRRTPTSPTSLTRRRDPA